MNTISTIALAAGLWAARAPVADDPVPDEAVEVSIEKLTSVDYKPGRDLPEDIAELDGKLVEIEGYMAIGTLEGVEGFELVPEPCECGRSKVQHFIDVTISEGTTTFKPGRIVLKGKLSVGVVEEDGFVTSLYRLEIRSLDE
jgi:hypothetical protein